MTTYLRADTATEVLIGPAVAVGDGFTPVTTLVLTSADEAEIIKYNGATTLTGAAITNVLAALTSAVDGYYSLELTTTELNTEGPLWLVIQDDSLILPIRQEYMVVSANVYDSLFDASGTDVLDVSVTQWLGTAAATPTVAGVPEVDITHQVGGLVPTPATTGVPDVNLVEWLDGTPDALSFGDVPASVEQMGAGVIDPPAFTDAGKALVAGAGVNHHTLSTSAAGSTTTLIDSTLTEVDDFFIGWWVVFTSGANVDEIRLVTDFDAASDTLTFAPAVPATVASGTAFSLRPMAVGAAGVPEVDVTFFDGGAIPTPNTTGVPDVNVVEFLDSAATAVGGSGKPDVHVFGMESSVLSLLKFSTQVQRMLEGAAKNFNNLTTSSVGTTTTLIDTTLTEADDWFNGWKLVVVSGANIGLVRLCTDFDNASSTLTFTPAMPNVMGSSDTYFLIGDGGADIRAWDGTAVVTPTSAGMPDVNVVRWNDSDATVTAGVPDINVSTWLGGAIPTPATTGVPDVNVTEWADNAAALISGLPSVAVGVSGLSVATVNKIHALGNFNDLTASSNGTTTTLIDTVLSQADDHWNGLWVEFTSGTNKGQVRLITDFDDASNTVTFAPAVEVATATNDTFSILPSANPLHVIAGEIAQGTPPALNSILDKLRYLYMTWRNLKDNDGTTTQVYEDDGTTVAFKSTTSEAAGTVTETEKITGP